MHARPARWDQPAAPNREALRAARELLGENGLTARSPVDRRDALRGWCAQLPGGAPVPVVEHLADHLLTKPRRRANRPVRRAVAGRCRAQLRPAHHPRHARVEQAVVDAALAHRDAGVAIAKPVALEIALAARPTLSAAQEAMVRQLTGSGAGVDDVVGKVSTGKRTALAAAREAWQASGTLGSAPPSPLAPQSRSPRRPACPR